MHGQFDFSFHQLSDAAIHSNTPDMPGIGREIYWNSSMEKTHRVLLA
jgi:hypothetical protein